MPNPVNRHVRLKSRPAGIPEASHFEIVAVQAPGSIAGLYRGDNLGKRLIRIAPENS